MMRARLVAAGVAVGLAAWGCRGAAPQGSAEGAATVTSPHAQAQPRGPVLTSRIHPDLPEFSFTLIDGARQGSSPAPPPATIEIRRGAETRPWQVIGGLEVESSAIGDAPALEVLDMDFDGYADLRVAQFRPAAPNVPYFNWLFDPASGRFVRSAELDAIVSPVFDAQARQIRSEWRDGAARYGIDIYEIVRGKPLLARKELREYTQPGVHTRTVSRLVDGAWKVVERRVVRE